jgi:hypothetical protein
MTDSYAVREAYVHILGCMRLASLQSLKISMTQPPTAAKLQGTKLKQLNCCLGNRHTSPENKKDCSDIATLGAPPTRIAESRGA